MFEKYYLQRRKQIPKYTPELFEYRRKLSPESEESMLSAFTTWESSFEQLGKDRQQIEHLLTLSAFFYHKNMVRISVLDPMPPLIWDPE